ncbi:MAG: 23S rRNA (uracil(1939)-C(5))-methyltransferase RlmD [Candidatus Marinimicrobia bacterium]|nr:23S rRNA (uracil(1939)-C(5))-methyltransferase RlmD [Candidatus Neomarinimicrobiota bacterium]
MNQPIKKKDILDLKIVDLSFHGKGIAKFDHYTIFVDDGIPGQKVKARINRAKKSYAEASIVRILEKSDFEIVPPCKYHDYCGGCKHQNIPYAFQLKFFHQQITELYRRLGGFSEVTVNEVIGSENIYHYRNKMEFSFSPHRWLITGFEEEKPKDFALGLRAPGNFWKSIDLDQCLIAPEESAKVMELVRNFALAHHLTPYDQHQHQGFLRHLMIRKGFNTGQLMVNIVTAQNTPEIFQPLVHQILQEFPDITSIMHTVATNKSGTTIPEIQNLLYGRDFIEDKLGALIYKISAASFFQTNTKMAETLYEEVRKTAAIQKHENVWDLYCGTGSIGLFVAPHARSVTGIEVLKEAVHDAVINARNNHITNVEFLHGNLDTLFEKQPELPANLPKPDVLIVDPPRGGLHPKLVAQIISLAPRRIVYVSCNPATQVRDIKMLYDGGNYQIDSIQPVDMFPHTPHIEVVTGISKR